MEDYGEEMLCLWFPRERLSALVSVECTPSGSVHSRVSALLVTLPQLLLWCV